MAKWVLYQNRDSHLTFQYRTNGEVFTCGELRADTPKAMVLDWILNQPSAASGDIIKFQDGQILSLLKPVSDDFLPLIKATFLEAEDLPLPPLPEEDLV